MYVTNLCTPSKQVGAAALKANQVLGQVMRAFTYRDRFMFVKLFKLYVRPQLEYCIQAWCPWLKKDIEMLENVQRRAVRAVSGLSGSYKEKLLVLKLPSLQQRRLRGDMIQTFKTVMEIDDVDPNIFFSFTSDRHGYATRQAGSINANTLKMEPAYALSHRPCKLDIRKYFFSNRVVSNWNSLPNETKNSATVEEFKIKYDYFPLNLQDS